MQRTYREPTMDLCVLFETSVFTSLPFSFFLSVVDFGWDFSFVVGVLRRLATRLDPFSVSSLRLWVISEPLDKLDGDDGGGFERWWWFFPANRASIDAKGLSITVGSAVAARFWLDMMGVIFVVP